MNCLVVETRDDTFVVDCGVTFPENTYGADIVHPRFDYLLERKDRVRAIVVTHAHEDHVGAVPYLLRVLDAPVYAPPYAAALLAKRLEEVQVDAPPEVRPLVSGRSFGIGDDFEIEAFSVHHSIPEAHGLVMRTPAGLVVHTGDFKIESDPADGQRFDREVLERARRRGVRLLLSDSTNVDVEGRSGLERDAEDALLEAAREARGRVIVGSFASNAFRLQGAVDVARKTGRRIALLGRSMQTHARIQEDLGHLDGLAKLLVHPSRLRSVPRDELLVLATGTQGEPPAALSRLAKGTHPDLDLDVGDLVVLSSRVIPGKELEVHGLVDAFERRGLVVYHRRTHPGLHASGHASRAEQREMIELLRPESFMPVHGTFHHLTRHAALARESGVEDTLVIENGTSVELTRESLRPVGTVPFGLVHCAKGEVIADSVLRDRALLAKYGIVSVAVVTDAKYTRFGPVRVGARGLLDLDDDDDRALLRDAERAVLRELRGGDLDHAGAVEHAVSRVLRRFFHDELGIRPMIDVLVVGT